MAKNLKILHISSPKSWRGGEQQLAYLVEELEHQKDVEQVLLVARNSAMEKYCGRKGFLHYNAPRVSGIPVRFARKLAKVVKAENIDLIHAHDSHAHTACILACTFFSMRKPIVLSRRVDFRVGKSWFSRFKYNHPQVKKIICVSEAIKNVMTECIERPDRLTVVYSGVDINKFPNQKGRKLHTEYGLAPDIPLVGNVAALADHKDYFTFVDTVESLVKAQTHAAYFIIGDGPQRVEIERYIAQKKLTDIIKMTGFREDIIEIMPELDILLFTSKMEGLGTTILDAYAARVAVVATAGGGIPELIEHGETGFLAEVKDAKSCAEFVQNLLENPDLKEEFRRKASERVKDFSKENTALRTLAVYRQI